MQKCEQGTKRVAWPHWGMVMIGRTYIENSNEIHSTVFAISEVNMAALKEFSTLRV